MEKEHKKVLHYMFGSLNAGGAESLIVNIYEKLKDKGYQFDFIVNENKEFFYSAKILAANGQILPLNKNRLPILSKVKCWFTLYKIMKTHKYDAFHCHADFSFRIVELLLAKYAGIPVRIIHAHSSSIGQRKSIVLSIKKAIHIILRRYWRYVATDFITCSDAASTWMFGNFISQNKILFLKNGINTKRFRFSQNKYTEYRNNNLLKNSLVICNIGRFCEVKNQRFLLDLIKYAKTNDFTTKFCLLLLGDGVLKKELEQYAKKIGVEDLVYFVGNTTDTEKYLIMSDVYVMPSLYEGLPLSGIEAQCAGLPIIASSTVSKEMDITGKCYFLSLSEELCTWIQKIKEVIITPDQRVNAYKTVADNGFDIEQSANRLCHIYNQSKG
ncbi:glycosyltransferase [uncultured Succinivibrio sp.]|uniref:glycosyltransferase n=1 Tax=uncultured Succinivibrio sp. TaxID=540749 RepID=UPI0025D6BEEE|nr:glycosyltransferase [uncultured Succinivibrio sp.]